MKKFNLLLAVIISIAIFTFGCGKNETTQTGGKDEKTEKTTSSETKKDIEITENTAFHIVYEMAGDQSAIMEVFAKSGKGRSEIKATGGNTTFNTSAYFPGDGYVYTVIDVAGKKMGMKIKADETKTEKKDFSTYVLKFKDYLKDFEKEGTGDVIGYECDIYKDKDGNKYYVYKDLIMMKYESKTGSFTATKLEIGGDIDEKTFEVPKDVDFSGINMDMFK